MSAAFLIGMLYMRKSGKTISGEKIDQDHPMHSSVKRFLRTRNIVIMIGILLLSIICVIQSTKMLLNVYELDQIKFVLYGAPVITLVGFVYGFLDMRRKLGK